VSDAFESAPSPIELGKLRLRALSTGDAAAVYAYASDPELAQFTLWPPHHSEEFTRDFLSALSLPMVLSWAITLRADESIIGMVFFHSLSIRHKKAELAFNVARSHWRHGIATEAAQAAIHFAFERLLLNRVEATCMPANIASRRVLEKIGMSKEGTMRRSHSRYDGFHDMDLFSILRDERKG
jgi:[ribosomal protein S5]-alanine N-acetyltransferase